MKKSKLEKRLYVENPLFKEGEEVTPLHNNQHVGVIIGTQGRISVNNNQHWLYVIVGKGNYSKYMEWDKGKKTLLDSYTVNPEIPIFYEIEPLLKKADCLIY